MADTNEKIVLSVTLDYADAIKQTAQLATEITAAKTQLKELKAAGKEGTEEYQAQSQALKYLSDQHRQQSKAIQDSIKVQQANTGSIVQMRSEINKLTAEYINLTKEERESGKGKELLNKIKGTTDEVKSLEKAMGDNRRNVGNYSEAFKTFTDQINIGGVSLGNITNGLKGAASGFNVGTQGAFGFAKALAATGIGLIVVALGGLVALFSKFQPVVDKVEQALGGVGQVIQVLVARAGKLFEAFSAILSGNFSEGVDKLKQSYTGLTDEIGNAYNEGVKFAKAQQDIDDAIRANKITTSELNKEIDQLLLKSKNRTLTEKERIALLDEASKKEKQAFESTKAIADAELKLADDKYQAELKRLGSVEAIGDDIADARADAIVKVNNLESDSINLQEKIQNRRDALIDAESTKRAAALAKRLKDEEDFIKAQLDADAKMQSDQKTAEQQALKDREDAYNSANLILKRAFADAEKIRLDELAKGALTQQEFDNQQLIAKEAQLASQIELDKKYYKDTIDNEVALADTKTKIALKEAADKKAINDAKIEHEQQIFFALTAIAGGLAELAGKNTAAAKAVATAQTLISTYFTAQKAYESAFLPVPTVASPVLGVLSAAAAVVTGLGNVAKINSIGVGGAAAGGGDFMTKGPTLLLVGDNPGGVEQVSVRPISGKGQTSVAPGGNLIAMAGGGTLTSFGGYAERRNGDNGIFDYNALADAMAKQPAPMLSLTELNKVNTRNQKLATISEL